MTADIYDEHTSIARLHLETAAALVRALVAATSSEDEGLSAGDIRLVAERVIVELQAASTATEDMDRQVQRWRDDGRLLRARAAAA